MLWYIGILLIVFGLLGASLIVYIFQDKLMFFPVKLPRDHQFDLVGNYEEINLEARDGEIINGVLFKVKESRGLVFYLHNHSGNLETWSQLAYQLNDENYDVFLFDYRSFGKSTGKFNEVKTYQDSLDLYDLLAKQYPEESILVMARGMGACFATFLSKMRSPARLFLESPICDMKLTAFKNYPFLPFIQFVPKYKLDAGKHIGNVQIPVTLVHGEKNDLVSVANGKKLRRLNPTHVQATFVKEAGHYDLSQHPTYQKSLMSFLN